MQKKKQKTKEYIWGFNRFPFSYKVNRQAVSEVKKKRKPLNDLIFY